MEWWAFADESGVHGDARFCTVTGFAASPRQWKLFESDWKKALVDAGVTSFRANDFFGRAPDGTRKGKQYRHLSESEAKSFYGSLLDAMLARQLGPIGAAIDINAFNACSNGERQFLTSAPLDPDGSFLSSGAPNTPYFAAFMTAIVMATHYNDKATVNFVFDRNAAVENRAIETFNEAYELASSRNLKRLGRIEFDCHENRPGLQAADLFVHALNRHLERGEGELSYTLARLKRLTDRARRPLLFILDADSIEGLLSEIPTSLRERLRAR